MYWLCPKPERSSRIHLWKSQSPHFHRRQRRVLKSPSQNSPHITWETVLAMRASIAVRPGTREWYQFRQPPRTDRRHTRPHPARDPADRDDAITNGTEDVPPRV